jgi:hypothetical protein
MSTHTHADGAVHQHHGPELYPHVQGGPTVLDIGGDIGAMLVTMNPAAAGSELHLRSEHEPPIEIHTGVWHRQAGQRVVTTAVFAELVQGNYWVLDDNAVAVRRVEIIGGELTTIDLSD